MLSVFNFCWEANIVSLGEQRRRPGRMTLVERLIFFCVGWSPRVGWLDTRSANAGRMNVESFILR
jgi:hypothetical protein